MQERMRYQLGIVDEVISFIMACAPDRFPVREYLQPEEQPTLEREFEKLRSEFEKLSVAFGDSHDLEKCRKGIEESFAEYKQGNMKLGLSLIQEVLHQLMRLRKRK